MIAKLNHIAQTWERLLFHSGGSLNLKKCSWYILYWEWIEGRPRLRPIADTDLPVTLTQGSKPAEIPIKRQSLDHATRILSVHFSPLGDFSTQQQILKDKADSYASTLKSPRLTAADIRVFHRSIYAPAMKYSLPAIAVDEECFAPVQSKILAAMLNGIGVARTIPTAIRHGRHISMGGLDLLDLRTEAGISAIKLLRNSIFASSETGKMIIINQYQSQLESGLGVPLLEDPSIAVSYLTPTWLTSIRQFAFQQNLAITLTEAVEPQCLSPKDRL